MPHPIVRIRIHPGIGVARLGNSDEFFIGPEAPGQVVDPGGSDGPGPGGGTYRDRQMRLKRQAQRFRIYGYDASGKVVTEINSTLEQVQGIQWRVHVRNMKAANYAFQGPYLFDPGKYRNPSIQGDASKPIERDQLIIDPGPAMIDADCDLPRVLVGDVFTDIDEGYLPGYLRYCNFTPEDPSQPVKVKYNAARNVELGRLHLDEKQRLIFVPAPGKAECVTTPKVELSNPSQSYSPPNGPEDGKDPLTNQFSYFNVPGWWDDTCGGEIDATVTFKDGSVLSTRDEVRRMGDEGVRNASNGAWIVTAPPKYAPYMYHVVSILDRVYEAFPEANPNHGKPTSFYRDVYPVLARACNYGWVSAEAAGVDPTTRDSAHGPKQDGNLLSPENLKAFTDKGPAGDAPRREIYDILRHAEDDRLLNTLPPAPPAKAPPPRAAGEGPVAVGDRMPKLWGSG
ncbi:MAG: LodA/GoxA family CTQ-dependent oxidase, partial [Thermoanaerobaculales bacterium]|nr:LodA/GoxA family CTQ-dependent oxidase [Thermoanaerobaculales bacterium]